MLLGGSQADSGRTFTHGFFHEGTRSTQFKASSNYFLRILPAFDEDKNGTPEYSTSYVPYRSKELPEDWKTKTPGFTSWFFVVQAYTWLGKGNQSLITPLSLGGNTRNKQGVDPIQDVRIYCDNSDDAELRKLIVDVNYKERAAAPTSRYFVLCNVLLMTDTNSKKTENQIGIFTNAAWNDLKTKMAYRAGRNDEVISKDWEDYIYGDVTHPAEGLAASIRETSAEGLENVRFAGIHFADTPGRLEGHQKWDLSTDTTALENRYRISEETVTKVWSYDEILDYIVKDAVIPYDVIEKACAPYAVNGIPKPAGAVSAPSDYNIPSQVQDSDEDSVSSQNSITTPAVEKVAEVPVVTAPTPTEVVAATPTPTPSEPTPSTPVASTTSGELTDEQQARYEELSEKFKRNASELNHTDLPEYFDLCARLGISPSKD